MSPALDYAEVADLYDSYVRFAEDLPFFLAECQAASGPVLELMAGTGRVSLPLAEAGLPLTCVDSSPDMLDVLRRKLRARNLSATLVCQDVVQLELRREYELCLLPFHSFAELITESQQRAVLARVRSVLIDGGCFICTLHNPAVRLRSVGRGPHLVGEFPCERGGTVRLTADLEHDPARRRVSGFQVLEHVDAEGWLQAQRTVAIRFAVIKQSEFEAMAQEAGFTVVALFGDYTRAAFSPDTSPYMIWKLCRPAVRSVL